MLSSARTDWTVQPSLITATSLAHPRLQRNAEACALQGFTHLGAQIGQSLGVPEVAGEVNPPRKIGPLRGKLGEELNSHEVDKLVCDVG